MDKIISCFQEKQISQKNKEIVATLSIQIPPKVTDFKIKSVEQIDEKILKILSENLKNLKINTLTDFSDFINKNNYKKNG